MVVVAVVVVPGSVLGEVVVVVWPVVETVEVSELWGVVLGAGVEAVGAGVVATGVLEVVPVRPAVPVAATVGVVACASTVASVWVWVRPGGGGGGVGFALALAFTFVVAGVAGLAGVTVLCAVVAVVMAAAGLCAFLTATWRWTTGRTTGAGGTGVAAIAVWVGTGAAWVATAW